MSKGAVTEPPAWASHGATGLAQLDLHARCSLAGARASAHGPALVPSRDLVARVLDEAGFDCSGVRVVPPPHLAGDVGLATYTHVRRGRAMPHRYFLRCVRRRRTVADEPRALVPLEISLKAGTPHVVPWTRLGAEVAHEMDAAPATSPRTESGAGHLEEPVTSRAVQPPEGEGPAQGAWQGPRAATASVSPEELTFHYWPVGRGIGGDGDFDWEATDDMPSLGFTVGAWGRGEEQSAWEGGDAKSTTFGFVFPSADSGAMASLHLEDDHFTISLRPGMYFAATGRLTVSGASGCVVRAHAFQGLFTVGGPIEATGRLPYIDGCTDTLLVSPPLLGDPCLNLLHFPPHTTQTLHTHPSGRAGCVARGSGVCVFAKTREAMNDGGRDKLERVPLTVGTVFVIPTGVLHAFETTTLCMDVIAFHPDSDYGPAPLAHPMINRTYVGGVSASKLPGLQHGNA